MAKEWTLKDALKDARENANIAIALPHAPGREGGSLYEIVTVNGVSTPLPLGEAVKVSWMVYEALKHGRYADVRILA